MSKAQNFDVSRLPPYRTSLIERFHPYARVSSRRPQNSLMTRVDYRYGEEAGGDAPAPCTRSLARCEEAHNDASTYEEDLPVVGVDVDDSEAPVDERLKLARSKLVEALTERLDALRSMYPILQAVRAFLPPGQAK